MCRKLFVTAILSLCVCVTFNLYGVEVKKKEINSFESFQEGNFNGTGLDNKGGIFIGPKIKALNGPTREYYLSLETDKSGNIYVGTGHKGSVFKISPRAAASEKQMLEVFKSDDLDVYALLVRNGHVFVGTSPDGKLYKVVDSKKPEVFFNPEEKFIWDIVEDAMGNIIIATGNTGSVYRIGKNAGGVKIFSSEDNHMVSLYVTRSGSILAGSGDRGILYQIDNTKVKVLFDSPFEEIRGICEDKDGNIFFSATHGIKKNASQTADTGESFMKRTEKRDKKPPKEKSILYCRRTNGVVEPVWFSKTEYIYSICYDENDNSVLVGTGNSGRVYRVTKEGNFGILYESDAAQVYKIRKATEGFYLLTNNSASIAFVENTLNSKGVYYSEIYDLDIQSRLGKIYWESETPPNTDVVLSVRAGNSNVPDSTWGQWSAPYTLPESSTMGLTDVRYFQVKAVLNASNLSVSPRLNSFKAFYIQSNLKPRVKKVIVRKALGKSGGTKKNPALQKNTNYLAVNWQVMDPNKDKLKFNLYLKKVNARHWIHAKKELSKNKTTIDTRLFDDGKYQLKVVADDGPSNPPTMALSHQLVNTSFLIDSTAPLLTGFTRQGKKIAFTVTDAVSIISHVRYSYDGKMWFPLFPVDKISDSKKESYDFVLKDIVGKKIIFIKVADEYKNSKVFQEEL